MTGSGKTVGRPLQETIQYMGFQEGWGREDGDATSWGQEEELRGAWDTKEREVPKAIPERLCPLVGWSGGHGKNGFWLDGMSLSGLQDMQNLSGRNMETWKRSLSEKSSSEVRF